jgi:hypothetical protein
MSATSFDRLRRMLKGGACVAMVAAAPAFAQQATPPAANPQEAGQAVTPTPPQVNAAAEGGAAPAPAATGTAAAASAPATAEPSPNAMENLIRLLVGQKVITAQAGQALLGQAQTEAAQAQAKLAASAPAAGSTRVAYVPQVVKDQIRDELKADVMKSAQQFGWVSPNTMPDWVNRITLSGDVRFRNQYDIFSDGNANDVIDFAQFNANGPTDINGSTNPTGFPISNFDRDRNHRLSIRARLAITANVTPGVIAGIRLASGNNDGPVSTTQLLGGGFNKKDIWLDRAFVTLAPAEFASLTLGRMANPFVSTDLLYDEDVNFDGAALTLSAPEDMIQGAKIYATGGAFPFEYGDGNFPNFQTNKSSPRDKWIYGGQIAGEYEFTNKMSAKLAVAYYDFSHVQGRVSEPCELSAGGTECSTDGDAPAFLSKGNTLRLLRNIVPDPASPLDFAQPQLAGLSFDYNLLDVNAQFGMKLSDRMQVSLAGNYVRNLGYDEDDICAANPLGLPITNVSGTTVSVPADSTNPGGARTNVVNTNPCAALPNSTAVDGAPLLATFRSGNQAWMLRAALGSLDLKKRGDWTVSAGYKRIEPDAMLDSLTDSDFHLGGTNAKGYVLSGTYMIWDGVRLTARYLSANEVYGTNPLGIDVAQIDLVVGF